MRKLTNVIVALLMAVVFGTAAAQAKPSKIKNDFTVTGNLAVTGTSTLTGNITQSGNSAVTGNSTVAGNASVTGTLSVGGAVTFTTPVTAANIQTGSAKRQLLHARLSPPSGDAVDSTVYRALVFPGRAGTVKAITFGCEIAPTVGTDTIKVLKGSSAGNTMLSTASFDANTLTANQGTAGTLTATGADLGVAATGANSGIYCEYSAGTQTVDARDVEVTIEYEPTDF